MLTNTWVDGKVPKERENLLIQETESHLPNECPWGDRIYWPRGQTQFIQVHLYLKMMDSGWMNSEVLSRVIYKFVNWGTFLDPCWREKRNSAGQKERRDVGLRRRERPWRLVRKEKNHTTSEEQRTHVSYLCEYSLTFQKWSYKSSQEMTVKEL